MNSLLSLAAAFIFFSIVFYWVFKNYTVYLESVAAGRLDDFEFDPKKLRTFRLFIPIVRKSPLYDLGSKINAEKAREKIHRIVLAAGLNRQLDANDIFGLRIFFCILVPGFLGAFSFAQGDGVPFIVFLIAVMGFFFPMMILNSIKSQRQKDILMAFPFVLDLLTLSTEAGLDFMGALAKVSEKAPESPLVEELNQVIKEIKLGSSRAEALRAMAQRVDMQEISSFVAVLIANEQMGAGVGRVLRAQSDTIRNDRFVRAEKAGEKATQLMLFPLIFIIMPAVFIMIFGPVVTAFFYGGFK